eukprot:jgi/Tetstr1/456608/TSEL_043311.t1
MAGVDQAGAGGVQADGRTPARFLSTYFNAQCNIFSDAVLTHSTANLSQNEPVNQSQDFFGTQDFITPQDQEFSVMHNPAAPGETNKENVRQMRSPMNISPGARKRPKKCLYQPTGSQKSDDMNTSQGDGSQPSATPTPSLIMKPAAAPVMHGRGSILHYCKDQGTSAGHSPSRGRQMLPPPVRSPPLMRNPFLEPEHSTSGAAEKKKARVGQPPRSRYRADFKEMGLLGSGSFSKVYRVKHRLDGCEYAVKRTAKELYTASEKTTAIQEIQALAAVGSHPNIVRYFGAWMEPSGDGEHLFIQLEVCGKSLADQLAAGHVFSETHLMDIMKQIAGALRHLHQLGMVHLDVKPDNIYMSLKDSSCKLGDFGLVSRSDGQGEIREGDGRYLPKEMMNGDHSNLQQADMYSLGATMLELAIGSTLPMDGSLCQALRQDKAPLPKRLNANSQLVKYIKALLSETPSERPTAETICRGSAPWRKGVGSLLLQPSTLSRSTK